MKLFKVILVFFAVFFLSSPLFSETEKWNKDSFPQWSKDLRRTEIITFGSLPFVTLWTSVGYGLAVQGTFHNPLDKSTSNYTEAQQKQIIGIAACASLGLGLTDLAVNLIIRNIKKNKQNKIEKTIRVIPYSQLVTELPPAPEDNSEKIEEDIGEFKKEIPQKEYMIKGMEDAAF